MTFGSVFIAAGALLLAALVWSGRVELWHVYALALVLGLANAFEQPTRQAFVVNDREYVKVEMSKKCYIEVKDQGKARVEVNQLVFPVAPVEDPIHIGDTLIPNGFTEFGSHIRELIVSQ